jgi:corrinoid protein of di/trimethylamine methyltransferase
MSDELLRQITESLVQGDPEATVDLTRQALAAGLEPLAILNQGLMPGMQVVGEKFASGEYFLPHLVVAASGMQGAMALLEPALRARQQAVQKAGTVVIGTVRGDIHDIGKNIVAMMLEGAGFGVINLGHNVAVEQFVAAVEAHQAHILGMSALLTTSMPYMKAVIEALVARGLRERVVVLVGGAPLNQVYAREFGADAYCRDAYEAVHTARHLLHTRWGRES